MSANTPLSDFVENTFSHSDADVMDYKQVYGMLLNADVSLGLLADVRVYGQPKYSSFKVYPTILNNIFSVYPYFSLQDKLLLSCMMACHMTNFTMLLTSTPRLFATSTAWDFLTN